MNLSINTTRTLITVESTLLDSFISNPSNYVDIKIDGYFSNTDAPVSHIYTNLEPIGSTTSVATNGGIETILPDFFTTTEFAQGVYQFVITLTSDTEISVDQGCLYVENGLKCDVDDYLLDESKTLLERVLIGLKYKSLLDVSTCSCKCDKYIEIYNDLIDTFDSNTCKTC